MSIRGWDITTFSFWKQQAAILEFFRFVLPASIFTFVLSSACRSFCIFLPNFIRIGPSAEKLWRHSDIQDGDRQPGSIFSRVIVGHPRRAVEGFGLILNFDLIGFLLSEILLFYIVTFWLEIAYLCAAAGIGWNDELFWWQKRKMRFAAIFRPFGWVILFAGRVPPRPTYAYKISSQSVPVCRSYFRKCDFV